MTCFVFWEKVKEGGTNYHLCYPSRDSGSVWETKAQWKLLIASLFRVWLLWRICHLNFVYNMHLTIILILSLSLFFTLFFYFLQFRSLPFNKLSLFLDHFYNVLFILTTDTLERRQVLILPVGQLYCQSRQTSWMMSGVVNKLYLEKINEGIAYLHTRQFAINYWELKLN